MYAYSFGFVDSRPCLNLVQVVMTTSILDLDSIQTSMIFPFKTPLIHHPFCSSLSQEALKVDDRKSYPGFDNHRFFLSSN